MASTPKLYDLVMETTTTTGTGTLTLAGAVTGFQTFAVVGDSKSCFYCIQPVDANGNPSGGYEVGVGTYTASGTTLSRTEILASSNSGAAVSLAAGTKRVFLVNPAVNLIATPNSADFGGRLTLTSGTAVTTSDVTAAGTIYYTNYIHNYVPLWDGNCWQKIVYTNNKSLSLTLTSGKNYDVYGYLSSGDLALELSAAWTNDTTRADALSTQDGIQVKSADKTRVYLGTIRASGANTTEDSLTNRFVFNWYNQVIRTAYKNGSTSHTYSTASTRNWDNSATETLCNVLIGIVSSDLVCNFYTRQQGSSVSANLYCVLNVNGTVTSIAQNFAMDGLAQSGFAQNFPAIVGLNTAIVQENAIGGVLSTFYEAFSQVTVLM